MELDNFVIQSAGKFRILSPKPTISNEDPLLFSLAVYSKSDLNKSIWQTVEPGTPFLRSSIGNDSLTPGNGEYRIIQDNRKTTTHQSIQDFRVVESGEVYQGTPPSQAKRVVISGELLYQPEPRGRRGRQSTVDMPLAVLKYKMFFYEVSKHELALEVSIEDLVAGNPDQYDRVHLQYAAGDDEEFFGLGETFSYWSLKGQRVPIISREQGIGRGKQPLTYIQNHIPPGSPAYSGGDALSTYTAIAHYITSQARSIYLHNSELSFFDFTVSNKVVVEVVSRKIKLSSFYSTRPLDLVSKYTSSISGRQAPLPGWISGENGAVIGLQGGEEKVLQVVKNLTDNGVPVAAVWLQDWVGTRQQPLHLTFPIPFLIPGFPGRTTATISIKGTSPQKRLWWNWEHDRKLYPNWRQFIKTLKDKYNIRVMTYINPFLSDVDEGAKPRLSWERNYFREASDLGFLVKRWVKLKQKHTHDLYEAEDVNVGIGGREMLERQHVIEDQDGSWQLVDYLVSSGPGVSAGMIDLTNRDAFEWYKNIIKDNMLSFGVSGWMADFAEYLPFDGVLHSQLNKTRPPSASYASERADVLSPHSYHNVYPREWARLNKEAVAEVNKTQEVTFFMRSAYSDSPKYCNAFWNGDQLHTWDHLDGLESTIFGSMQAGLSGVAFSHSDIGGYTTLNVDPKVGINIANRTTYVKLPIIDRRLRWVRQDQELFLRWMEASVFTSYSMYRTHEGSVPDENLHVWSSVELMAQFKKYTTWFNKLKLYRDLLIQEHQDFGLPLMRPLYLHYPHSNKPALIMERLQFLYGPILLVVPITTPGLETLNQKIQEPPEDDDDDIPENQELVCTVDVPEQVSSDEEDHDANFGYNAVTAKGRVVYNVKKLATQGALQTLRLLFRAFPAKPDVESSPQRSLQVDDSSKYLSKSAPKPSFLRMSSESPERLKELGQLSFSRTKPKSDLFKPTPRNPIVAPTTVPLPKHGRPFIPAGTWKHVWTDHVFDLQDYNGMFVTENAKIKLPCPIGQPAIFVRDISAEEMGEMIRRHQSKQRSRGGEDIQYWLDGCSSQEPEILLKFAMAKYNRLRDALQVFLADVSK